MKYGSLFCIGSLLIAQSCLEQNHPARAQKTLSEPLSPVSPPEMTSSFGLFVVPDDLQAFGQCDSFSKGVDWKGPHITLAGFTPGNRSKIEQALADYTLSLKGRTAWIPDLKKVETSLKQYDIASDTLQKLTALLNQYKIENLRFSDWHIYCSNGIPDPSMKNLTSVSWSLVMVERNGAKVSWLEPTRIRFMK